MDIDLESKYVDIWLANGDASPDLAAVRNCFAGYAVTILRSGNGDVASLTASLLSINK